VANARDTDLTYAFLGAISRVEKQADGSVLIWGKATDGTLDSDGQIVDPVWADAAMAKWFGTKANIRQMHQPIAVGKGVQLVVEPDGQYVKSRIVEPTAVKLVDADVLSDYSVGIAHPRIIRDQRAPGGRIVGGEIVELSIVDRGANFNAHFAIAKRAGGAIQMVEQFVGAIPILKGGFTHIHTHLGPNGLPHKHEHTHAAGTAPHDEFQEGGPHAHAHTEASVSDDQAGDVTPKAAKAAKCGKCHGTKTFGGDQCPDCGGTGMAKVAKDADLGSISDDIDQAQQDASALSDDLDAIASDVDDVTGNDDSDKAAKPAADAKPDADAADDAKPAFPGASKPFGKPKAKKAKKSKGTPTLSAPDEPAMTMAAALSGKAAPSADDVDDASGPAMDADTMPPKKSGKARKAAPDDAPDAPAPNPAGTATATVTTTGTTGNETSTSTDGNDSGSEPKPKKGGKGKAKKAAKALKSAIAATGLSLAGDSVPWTVRRAHDATCPAYSNDALKAAYPALAKDGVAGALGSMVQKGIYSMLANEVAEDGGNGSESDDILHIAKAYDGVCDFLADEAGEVGEPTDALYLSARAELHTAFKAANDAILGGDSDGPSIPKPSDPPSPSQYQRPYISAGHQRQDAAATDVSVTSPLRPVDAGDFDRGPLGTDQGQQRSLADKMGELHDTIADWRPELCLMDGGTGTRSFEIPDAAGSYGTRRQPDLAYQRPPDIAQIDNQQGSVPRPMSVPNSAPAPGEVGKGIVAHTVVPSPEVTVSPVTQAMIETAVGKAVAPYITKIQTLEHDLDQVTSAGDPAQRAVRGSAGFVAKSASLVAQETQIAADRARKRERKVEFQRGLAASGDAGVRTQSRNWLSKRGIAIPD
jgi:hypothetical protein